MTIIVNQFCPTCQGPVYLWGVGVPIQQVDIYRCYRCYRCNCFWGQDAVLETTMDTTLTELLWATLW